MVISIIRLVKSQTSYSHIKTKHESWEWAVVFQWEFSLRLRPTKASTPWLFSQRHVMKTIPYLFLPTWGVHEVLEHGWQSELISSDSGKGKHSTLPLGTLSVGKPKSQIKSNREELITQKWERFFGEFVIVEPHSLHFISIWWTSYFFIESRELIEKSNVILRWPAICLKRTLSLPIRFHNGTWKWRLRVEILLESVLFSPFLSTLSSIALFYTPHFILQYIA